jgi:tetratricopeptide (TPR) repeat protein
MLGDALYLLAQTTGETSHLPEARKFYGQVLAQKPDEVYVRTSLGLTYFYDKPSDPRAAIREYRKALKIDPRHEATLQGMVAALAAAGEVAEAEESLRLLEEVNASNPEIANLRAQLAQRKNAGGERE